MKNIIKAINYQTLRDNFFIYSILACFYSLVMILDDPTGLFEANGGTVFAEFSSMAWPITTSLPLIIIVCRICGWDYNDKTMNYELLSGHSRASVYWGRAIPALIWGFVMYLIATIPLVALATIINGWGDNIDFTGALIRYTLSMLPIIRNMCEFVLITALVKNCYIAMISCFFLAEASSIASMGIEEYTKIDVSWQLGSSNIFDIFTYNAKFEYIGGEDITVYETALETSFIAETVIASLAFSIICLVVGYVVFKKSDMK